MKAKKLLILAILSGLITTFIFYQFLDEIRPSTKAKEVATVQVVTAAEDIKQYQEITAEQLAIKEMEADKVHPQAIKDKSDVIGKLANAELKTGEIILSHRVESGSKEQEVVSKKVTEGHRALSISVDYVKSVSNLIEPEDYVDVVVTIKNDKSAKSELVQEKVRVLAVGQRMVEKKKDAPPEEYLAVTLELKLEDAVEVINASERGTLQLVLHSKRVQEEVKKKDSTKAESSSGSAKLVPLPTKSVIRTGPGLDENVLAVVEKGTILKDLGKESTDEDGRIWFQVETPDKKTGWISSRIIKYGAE